MGNGPFSPIRSVEQEQRRQMITQATQFVGNVVTLCECGNPQPIVVPLIPGAGGAATCGVCATNFQVERLAFESPADGSGDRCNLKLRTQKPIIERPLVHG